MLAGADDRPLPGEQISSGPDQITVTAPSAPDRARQASRYAIPAPVTRASGSHQGE